MKTDGQQQTSDCRVF